MILLLDLFVPLAVLAVVLVGLLINRERRRPSNTYSATRDQQNDSARLTQFHQATFHGPAAHGFKKDHAAVILPIANRRTK